MVRSPAKLGTKNDCAGEDQQQFTRPDKGGEDEILMFLLVSELLLPQTTLHSSHLLVVTLLL
jgi:hypothetical protein